MVCALWSGHAGAAGGGCCEMSMAVWALGPDGDYVYAAAKKAVGFGCPTKYISMLV